MIASDDLKLVEHCQYLATQARQPVLHYEHHEVGYNYRMSNILAAIGIGQLEVLSERVERRRTINQLYASLLQEIDEISFMPEASYGESNKWLTVITIDDQSSVQPTDVISALQKENIESRPVWNPLHKHKAFAGCRCVGGEVAESLFDSGVCLPSGSSMSDEDVHRVANAIKIAFGK